jgi:hypothetical protein
MVSRFLIILLITIQLTSSLNAYKNENVASWDYGSLIKPGNDDLSYGLKLYAPSKPGNYGVVVFLIGLGKFTKSKHSTLIAYF